ncbi:23S rRNA (guanosine(2251)-2'-O)-methyltransferase RlmB [Flavobacteriaceae bacterium]|nr:23S rRNA (guanosine(2251)-2'-O)-methyltransferase RlmB [Flavobacteriaceae bacterium]
MDSINIFGIRAIIEAITAEKAIDKVWLLKSSQSQLFDQLLKILKEHNIPFSFVPVERMERFSSKNHQGAVARIGAINTQALEPLIAAVFEKKSNPLFVLLDGVTDARNFGAILRSAAATGVDAIIIPSSGSAPLNGDVVKTSAGGVFNVPIAKTAHLKDAIYLLQAHQVKIVGITEKATDLVYDQELKGPLALVFGAEDIGISRGIFKLLDGQAKLPMNAAMDSLNVSVACAVVFYEWVRQNTLT